MRLFAPVVFVIGVNLAACEKASEQADPPILTSNTLAIRSDTTMSWNGTKVDADMFHRLCKKVSRRSPQPEIHVEPDRLAKYDAVAKILTDIQRDGCTNIGFTGIDTGR